MQRDRASPRRPRGIWTDGDNALVFIQLVQRNPAVRENNVTTTTKLRLLSLAAVAAGFAYAASPALAQETITVWWGKGFYKAEDDALLDVIKKFEAKTGIKVELSQYAIQDMIPKTVAALDSGTVPDVAYSDTYDVQAGGKWAFEGKLEDLSDILVPMKDKFAPNTLETAYLLNGQTKKKGYYGFPLKQQSMHVQIWGDMLEQAGFKQSDIPTTWKEYWSFWCDKVQPAIRKATRKRIYGVGQPMGVESTDSFQSFYTFMDAYNVKLVDDEGKLLVDDPKVKAGLVNALRDYTDTYIKGCTPPSSTTWKDPDNNVAFHNKTIVMTHNFTISIAAKWYEDAHNPALTPEQREAGKKAYEQTIITASFPKKPDGTAIKYRSDVKTGVIFSAAKHKKEAKEFVAFLLQEENLGPYVEGALGRWFPVTLAGQKSPFWQADRHRKAVYNQFMGGTLPFDFTKNFKFTILNNENVWAKAMNRVVSEKVPVDKAVDELIARIKQVAG
ncbi:MAG: carbohydrate ABC transporter substrate-binding protein [Rhizobiales bacterium]|nr:carbohydrate ABC transporter substrate-binding protein [Hyphomicrobiales bacterium]